MIFIDKLPDIEVVDEQYELPDIEVVDEEIDKEIDEEIDNVIEDSEEIFDNNKEIEEIEKIEEPSKKNIEIPINIEEVINQIRLSIITVRNFTEDEITEISSYIREQIPQGILPKLYILTEEPIKKIRAFIAIYRIVSGIRDYTENEITREKITNIINQVEDVYLKLYNMLIDYDNSIPFGKKRKLRTMINVLNNSIDNLKINKLINEFLIFAEKQILLETDKVTGINMDMIEGKELYNKLTKIKI